MVVPVFLALSLGLHWSTATDGDSFGCPAPTLHDSAPRLRLVNNNSYNALSIATVQNNPQSYPIGFYKLHCSNTTEVIPPGSTRTVDLDRSAYMLFLEWHAPTPSGGWKSLRKAPPGEVYKADCATTSGWPQDGVLIKGGDIGTPDAPYCDDDADCWQHPNTSCVRTGPNPYLETWNCRKLPPTPPQPESQLVSRGPPAVESPESCQYPESCGVMGEPPPQGCTQITLFDSEEGGMSVLQEVAGVGLVSAGGIQRVCESDWITMVKVLNETALLGTFTISPHVFQRFPLTTLAASASGGCYFRTVTGGDWRSAEMEVHLAPVDQHWCEQDGKNVLDIAAPFVALRSADGSVSVLNVTLSANFTRVHAEEVVKLAGEEYTAIDLAQGASTGFWLAAKGMVTLKTLHPPRVQTFTLDPDIVIHRIETAGVTISHSVAVLFSRGGSDQMQAGYLMAGAGKANISHQVTMKNGVGSMDVGLAFSDNDAGPVFMEFTDSLHVTFILNQPDPRVTYQLPTKYVPFVADWVNTTVRRTILRASIHHNSP